MSTSGGTDHANVFASLSDPTRVDILQALWEADDHRASFSELRKALDMRDSGKFNYHLDQLGDQFVTKTDDGDYRLRLAGIHVVGSLIAGTYAEHEPIEGRPFGEPCPNCSVETVFQYDGEVFTVECPECPMPVLSQGPAPPSVFADTPPEAVPDRARQYIHSLIDDVRSEFCLYCESPVETTIRPYEALPHVTDGDEDRARTPILQQDCPRCGESIRINLGPVLTRHPAVVSFFYEHGKDVHEVPIFDLTVFSEEQGAVTGVDPTRAWVRYTADDETLELTVDESLTALDVTRTAR